MNFDACDYGDAKRMVEQFHYAGRMSKGSNICYEWRDGSVLYAVACSTANDAWSAGLSRW